MNDMKFLIISCLLLVSSKSFAQNDNRYSYQYSINTQFPGMKKDFAFYFIIDSNVKYEFDKAIYYKLTFSQDSTENSGFISIDSKGEAILFVADTNNIKGGCVSKIYDKKSKSLKKVCFVSSIGRVNFLYKLQGDSISFIIQYPYPKSSHSVYLSGFNFNLKKNYPSSLTFFFPFEKNATVKIYGRKWR
jgi:hypothetical protein